MTRATDSAASVAPNPVHDALGAAAAKKVAPDRPQSERASSTVTAVLLKPLTLCYSGAMKV